MRKFIAGIIEVDDLFQTLKVAIVSVRLDEVGTRPHVYVPQCRDLELPVKLICKLRPLGIRVESRISEKGAYSFIHEPTAGRVGSESVLHDDAAAQIPQRSAVSGEFL